MKLREKKLNSTKLNHSRNKPQAQLRYWISTRIIANSKNSIQATIEVAQEKLPVGVLVVRTRTIQSVSEPSPAPVYFGSLRYCAQRSESVKLESTIVGSNLATQTGRMAPSTVLLMLISHLSTWVCKFGIVGFAPTPGVGQY